MISFNEYRKLNEKFVEDSDPVEDLGIGLNFSDLDKFTNFLIRKIPSILGTSNIPDDIIYPLDHRKYFNELYFHQLENYITNFVKFKGKNIEINQYIETNYLHDELYRKLIKMGYPKE